LATGREDRTLGLLNHTRDDRVRNVFKGSKRTKGLAQRQKDAAVTDVLVAMVRACPDTLIGLRDRALLLFGFASALRRAELCGLTTSDVEFTDDGVLGPRPQ